MLQVKVGDSINSHGVLPRKLVGFLELVLISPDTPGGPRLGRVSQTPDTIGTCDTSGACSRRNKLDQGVACNPGAKCVRLSGRITPPNKKCSTTTVVVQTPPTSCFHRHTGTTL